MHAAEIGLTVNPAKRDTTPEFDALIKMVEELGEEAASGDQQAEEHRYWFFRPAGQVESARAYAPITGSHQQ
jgi:hypothetical protein